MSKDIRSFFKIDYSKKRKNEHDISPIDRKKNVLLNKLIASEKESKEEKNKKKRRIIESDGEDEIEHNKLKVTKTQTEEKCATIERKNEVKDIGSLFGGPVKRSERTKTITPKKSSQEASDKNNFNDEVVKIKEMTSSINSFGKENLKTSQSPVKESSSPSLPHKDDDKKKERLDVKVKFEVKEEKPLDTIIKKSTQLSSPPKHTSSSLSSTSKQCQSSQEKVTASVSNDEVSFVDKYKPTTVKQIIGQQGNQSNAHKLQQWLLNWYKNHGDPNKKPAKANPYAKNNDGSSFKAVLLSGQPGIGKTTTAHLVAKECLFDIVEFNASDTRSKKLLKEEVSQLLANKSLKGYLTGAETSVSKRHVLIMDEVDGCAGNEDRGGISELIQLIKESRIPIICMCNDRSHPKIRSLVNYCFDLRFNKPSLNQIRGAMMSICFKEGIKMEPGAVDHLITGTGNDIRQTLNHLALYSANKDNKDQKISTESAKKNAQMSEKDVKIGPWDVIRKVFSADEHKTMSFNDKSDLFFYDYNIAPLFVQENYLLVRPACKESQVLTRVAKTAESLSLGDMVEKKIRSNMAWSLLPTQAVFSSVLPGEYMKGSFKGPPTFPTWLGKNSKSQKRKRLAQELHDHTRIVTTGSRMAIRLDYSQYLIKAIIGPLNEKGLNGVKESLDIIKSYHLLREDIDSLLEITTWGSSKSPWEQVDSKVKAALTRAYNKEIQPYSYSVQSGVKKKKMNTLLTETYGEDEDNAEELSDQEEEEEDSIESSGMIKVKKSTTSLKNVKSKVSSSKSAVTKKASK